MEQGREKYTKNYIERIMKNRNFIQPTKSCNLQTFSHNKIKPYDIEPKLFDFNKNDLANIRKLKGNKIFQPAWKHQNRKEIINKQEQNKKLFDIYLKKNQEIAAALMREKKSMSDCVYNLGENSKIPRYNNEQYYKNVLSQQIKIKTPQLLPKIQHKIQKQKSMRSIEYQETQIVMVNDKRLNKLDLSLDQESELAIECRQPCQPSYQDVANVNIKNFLRLKQHAYEDVPDEKNGIIQQLLKKKMKQNQNQKKSIGKKRRKREKNSLENYLQAKIIHRQERFKSVKQSCKFNTAQLNKNQEQQMVKQKNQQLNNFNSIQENKETQNERKSKTLQKSLKKIGVDKKISKKNLVVQVDNEISIYEQKMRTYRDFLFFINAAHGIFDPIVLSEQGNKIETKYKYYVGKGNNRQLVKALMKRRFWWIQTDDVNQANFVWTQLKNNSLFEKQMTHQRNDMEFFQSQIIQSSGKKAVYKKKNSNLYKAALPLNSLEKILTGSQLKIFQNLLNQVASNPQKYQMFDLRKKFIPNLIAGSIQTKNSLKVHNHFENNFYIGNKKALFYNLKQYCKLASKNLFQIVPLTFHIGQAGLNDPAYKQFVQHFKAYKSRNDTRNIWIAKPGENSNRGNGISVFDQLYQINKIINNGARAADKGPHTFIIQKYIEKPLLYKGRKFDIRHYMLATRLHGKMRLYFYGEGYVRTSSSDFDLNQIGDNQIHLTNDAIQKYAQNYGKYEQGNKISYTQLQRYIDATYPNRKYSMINEFYPKIKQIALDSFKACYLTMDPKKLDHNFQIFGLDFMIDANFNVWLIEVNTNPCLELSSNLLNRIIPTMLQHSFRLTIDPLFPPPCHYINTLKHLIPDNPLQRLQFQLIFDEARDGKVLQQLYKGQNKLDALQNVEQDQDTFDNDGDDKQVNFDIQ